MMAARLLSSHHSLMNGFRLLYSVIPVAGILVGGLIGFGAGMVGSWLEMLPVRLRVALTKLGAGWVDRSMADTMKTKGGADYVC
jgi:hypothetical protein